MADTPHPTSLMIWLTDRSRFDEGLDHCPRARFHRYHDGPHGYGWERKAQSIPALTGGMIHEPLAILHGIMRDHDRLPTFAETYAAIQVGVRAYEDVVTKRGLRLILDEADLQQQTREQLALLEGLVWVWRRVVLPAFHVEHQVVEVEVEDITIYGCTCGLGDEMGSAADHDARSCNGIGWQTRGDFISQHRAAGTYRYNEIKTTSDANMNWEAQWQYRTQTIAGVLGAEARLGMLIDEVVIHGLIKGKRMSEYSAETRSYSGPKYQQSPLVYAYRRAGNPPLVEEDWRPKFNYIDEFGKARRLTKDYERTWVGEIPPTWWKAEGVAGDYVAGQTEPICHSPLDYWTRVLDAEGTLASCYRAVGPIYRHGWKLESFVRQLVAEERRWQGTMWALHDVAQGASTETREQALDTLVPQARGGACRSYFGDDCAYLRVCERDPGWESPDLLGFIPRVPHHEGERLQQIGRGLAPSPSGLTEDHDEQ